MRYNQFYFLRNVLYTLLFLRALYGFLRRLYFWLSWQISSDIKKKKGLQCRQKEKPPDWSGGLIIFIVLLLLLFFLHVPVSW